MLSVAGFQVSLIWLALSAVATRPDGAVGGCVSGVGGVPPPGPGIAAASSKISSKTALIALPFVAPNCSWLACVVQVPFAMFANGVVGNAASPAARNASRIALPPAPFFWCSPTR